MKVINFSSIFAGRFRESEAGHTLPTANLEYCVVTLRRLPNLVGEEASLVARNHAGDWFKLSMLALAIPVKIVYAG